MAAALLRRRHSDRGNVTRMSHDLARYHRQILLPGFGEEGQRRLLDSTALLLGCGALGSVAADMLARAGVGHLVIVDRDFIELTNLQRQVLFDESDVTGAIPKAEAAKRKIARINSQVQVTAIVDDVNHTNIERFADGVDVIVDGLDNFEAGTVPRERPRGEKRSALHLWRCGRLNWHGVPGLTARLGRRRVGDNRKRQPGDTVFALPVRGSTSAGNQRYLRHDRRD
jgi:hypothetical protein